MRHQAVAERVFDEMERGLSQVLEREEEQPFEGWGSAAQTPAWPFVVGHFQVGPDGTVEALPSASQAPAVREQIEHAVATYWRPARAPGGARQLGPGAQIPGTTVGLVTGAPSIRPRGISGHEAAPQELSAFDALRSLNKAALERTERQRSAESANAAADHVSDGRASPEAFAPDAEARAKAAAPSAPEDVVAGGGSESELPAMTGRVIDGRLLMLYRTVLHGAQGYRQGVLLDVGQLGEWLRGQGLGSDALAPYARVAFATQGGPPPAPADADAFVFQHRFAEPFDDLTARLALHALPGATGVVYVYALAALLLATAALGLAALYRMVSVVVSFAEQRSNFAAAVSHELKTPLTAIRMYGEMLRDGMVSSEAKRDEYHRHITVEAERLSRLINNVLEFSRLEKGTRAMTLVSGSVQAVMFEMAELLRPHVERQGFALSVEVDADLPPVRYERDALMQVLWNLVDNAVKYTSDGSPKRIALRGWNADGVVHIAVRDHGPGVSLRHLGKIFEPFYRGEHERTRHSTGTGLGLALVRALADRMGARVSGRNVPDGGFEVEIAFRAAAP